MGRRRKGRKGGGGEGGKKGEEGKKRLLPEDERKRRGPRKKGKRERRGGIVLSQLAPMQRRGDLKKKSAIPFKCWQGKGEGKRGGRKMFKISKSIFTRAEKRERGGGKRKPNGGKEEREGQLCSASVGSAEEKKKGKGKGGKKPTHGPSHLGGGKKGGWKESFSFQMSSSRMRKGQRKKREKNVFFQPSTKEI